MRTATRIGALGAATALSVILAACGGANSGSMDHSAMSSGSSTTSTTSASPSVSATSNVDSEHNDQDVMFAQMMIVHHKGAIEMAQMATTQASSQQVKDLATTIEAAQQPEIEQMTSWLNAWGEPVEAGSSMEGMDHSSTSGMSGMSEEQMTQLQKATGTDFDQMFLQLMIEHHTGAVQMAETEQQQGSNPQAQELADSIVTSQSAEIEQMKQMLTTLG